MSAVPSKRPRDFSAGVVRLVKDAVGADGDPFDFEKL